MLHNIKIIDLASDLVKYEYAYAVLPDAKLTFNRPIYCLEEVELEISYIDYITTTFDISNEAYKQELRKKLTETA